jgi:transposase
MANHIKMDKIAAITCLRRRGWAKARIARELGVHRETVTRYIEQVGTDSKPTLNPPAGNFQNQQNLPLGNSGPKSACEPFREVIAAKSEADLSGKRIWQDLVAEHGFTAGYDSVKRFVARLRKASRPPFRRMESEPGQEAQVDFGKGAPVVAPHASQANQANSLSSPTLPAAVSRRRTHVLRITLSCSRKGYSESVFAQSTDNFIMCLENSFAHFGGVPATIVVDNLRAAVSKADWFDPELNPKVESFCRHYGTVILPAKPYTPRHKGKIERGIGYVQGNALKGRVFKSLEEQNRFLLNWETNVADLRIHGTTKKQVRKVFEEVERAALLPLPPDRFPCFKESKRSVHRDGHVEVDKAYYSVPPEYVGREVWVRWDPRMVHVFNDKFEEIAVHVKNAPGKFSTAPAHINSEKISLVERGATALLRRASLIGVNANKWAQEMLQNRGIAGMRVLIGLLSLARRYGTKEIDSACECALSYGAFRLKAVRALLKHSQKQTTLEFIQEHAVIRGMAEYGRLVQVSFGGGKGEIVVTER